MPIRKDGRGKRWVEMELLVPGTPEQVWQAMATGPGNAAWFVKAEIEPKVGGKLVIDFGTDAKSTGEVTTWEPPVQFAYVEREWGEGTPPCATEITITARSGDKCLVRMVHSLFAATDDWDDQVEGFEGGWPAFFVVLRLYLRHFAGMRAASFLAMKKSKIPAAAAWKRLCEKLGLASADVGDRRDVAAGPERWELAVEHVAQDEKQRYLVVRLDAPSPGVALVGVYDTGDTTNVSVVRYAYGEDSAARVTEVEARWRAWLDETFGEAPPPSP
jgi:uncharacterized protein YndB with AHSA1/START domain